MLSPPVDSSECSIHRRLYTMCATAYGGLQLHFEEEKENRYDDRYRKDVFRDPEQRFAEYGYHQDTIREKECNEQEQLVFTRAEERSAN